jgi:hypothetical protein
LTTLDLDGKDEIKGPETLGVSNLVHVRRGDLKPGSIDILATMKLDPASIHHPMTTALVSIAVIDNIPDIACPDFRYPGSRCSNIGCAVLLTGVTDGRTQEEQLALPRVAVLPLHQSRPR